MQPALLGDACLRTLATSAAEDCRGLWCQDYLAEGTALPTKGTSPSANLAGLFFNVASSKTLKKLRGALLSRALVAMVSALRGGTFRRHQGRLSVWTAP